jgi:type IV secretory pathway VirB10-like protein
LVAEISRVDSPRRSSRANRSNRGPVITLLAVAALAVVLVALNVTTTAQTAAPSPAAAPAATQEPPSALALPPPPEPQQVPPPAAEQVPPPAPEQAPPAAPEQVPPADPQQVTYAGRTSGNEATIAFAVRDDQVAAYLCDVRQVESWLKGTIVDGRLTVQGARDSSASGVVEGNAIFGTVSVNGQQWPYSAQLASAPAGLYQGSATANGVSNRIGWIVLQDGSQVGIENRNGIRKPAPRLDPVTLSALTVDGSRLEPQRVAGDTKVVGGPPA